MGALDAEGVERGRSLGRQHAMAVPREDVRKRLRAGAEERMVLGDLGRDSPGVEMEPSRGVGRRAEPYERPADCERGDYRDDPSRPHDGRSPQVEFAAPPHGNDHRGGHQPEVPASTLREDQRENHGSAHDERREPHHPSRIEGERGCQWKHEHEVRGQCIRLADRGEHASPWQEPVPHGVETRLLHERVPGDEGSTDRNRSEQEAQIAEARDRSTRDVEPRDIEQCRQEPLMLKPLAVEALGAVRGEDPGERRET